MGDLISRKGVSAWLDNLGYHRLSEAVLDEERFPSQMSLEILKDILCDLEYNYRNNSTAEVILSDVWNAVIDVLEGTDDE